MLLNLLTHSLSGLAYSGPCVGSLNGCQQMHCWYLHGWAFHIEFNGCPWPPFPPTWEKLTEVPEYLKHWIRVKGFLNLHHCSSILRPWSTGRESALSPLLASILSYEVDPSRTHSEWVQVVWLWTIYFLINLLQAKAFVLHKFGKLITLINSGWKAKLW